MNADPPVMTIHEQTSIDPEEVARFDALAAHWWNPRGEFSPLHAMNPVRLGFIRDRLAQARDGAGQGSPASAVQPLAGLRIADIGCGGGILAEPLARMGADVTGVDASQGAISAASRHADGQGLAIDYRCTTAEALAAENAGGFDAVTALEIVEHVSDVGAFVGAVAGLLRPGGMAFFSTLNRTAKSYATAIVGAEYMLGLLPRGTHDWRRFMRPGELEAALRSADLATQDVKGMVYSPLSRSWKLSANRLAINYVLMAIKQNPMCPE